MSCSVPILTSISAGSATIFGCTFKLFVLSEKLLRVCLIGRIERPLPHGTRAQRNQFRDRLRFRKIHRHFTKSGFEIVAFRATNLPNALNNVEVAGSQGNGFAGG